MDFRHGHILSARISSRMNGDFFMVSTFNFLLLISFFSLEFQLCFDDVAIIMSGRMICL